jgi:rhamnosyltransferase
MLSAIIVTLNPNSSDLRLLLHLLAPQVDLIFIIDNGSSGPIEFAARHGIELVRLNRNEGIAAAHNTGIRLALQRGTRFVLLLDQDSFPAPDMVRGLIVAHKELTVSGMRVAAVGPNYFETITKRFRHQRPLSEYIHEAMINSSGSLFSVSALREVGLMAEEFFIDHIDTEWCMRARAKGWSVFTAANARMDHTLGSGAINIFCRTYGFTSPGRYYYIFRNSVRLCAGNIAPFMWKLNRARILVQMLILAFLGAYPWPRLTIVRMMLLGILHGLVGRMGQGPDVRC